MTLSKSCMDCMMFSSCKETRGLRSVGKRCSFQADLTRTNERHTQALGAPECGGVFFLSL